MVFFLVYLFSFFFALGYEDWFMVWVGLEMNMMSFLSLGYMRGRAVMVESLFKYFFVQGLASGAFLVMMYLGGVIVFVMSLSLAAGPFYFWLPKVVDGVEWVVAYFLLSIQKLLPLILLSGLSMFWVWWVGLVSLFVGVMGSFNQSNLSKLMAFSSVGHLGWIMLALSVGKGLWFMYYLIYIIVLLPLVYYFLVSDMLYIKKGSSVDMFFLFVCFLSLSGMPPLFGFLMKWLVFQWMILYDMAVVSVLVLSSLAMFYIYTRVVYDGVVGGGSWNMLIVGNNILGVEVWKGLVLLGTILFPFCLFLM